MSAFLSKHGSLLIQLVMMLFAIAGLYYGLDKRLALIEQRTEDIPALVNEMNDVNERVARLEGASAARQAASN